MKKEKIYSILILIILIVLCSYPLFINLGSLSLRMWDESRNATNAFEMLHGHNFIVTHYDGQPDMVNTKPPLLIWCIALSMKLFGPTAFAIRLPSVSSALLIVIVSFLFSKKYLKSILPGFLAGIVLCTSLGFIEYHVARNGDFDAMLSMWIFLYSIFFFLYLETGSSKNLQLASLFIGLAILTKGIAACMALPGLLLFLLINKKYWSFLKKGALYIYPLIGFLIGLSYFIVREIYNPGFINVIIENDIVGRYSGQYLDVIGNHEASFWVYLQLMNDHDFSFWLPVIPFAIVITLMSKNYLIKRLGLFLTIVSFTFLLVISSSYSKLSWYDAPFYPFVALLIGLGLAEVCFIFNSRFTIKSNLLKFVMLIAFCISIFIIPVQKLFASPIIAKKETYCPALFYGDFINSVYTAFPEQKTLIIASDGYNPHLIFYSKVHQDKGRDIKLVSSGYNLQKNDSLLICETAMCPILGSGLMYDTLLEEDNTKYFMRVISISDYAKVKKSHLFLSKVNEIKNNPEWLTIMKEKALKNKIDFEKQIMLDALWLLRDMKKITPQEHDSITIKYSLN
ncbi:MAG: glycosyltransferase family 39 protein [Bacteroidetes bacterium]|nr:glycosyltransferase family 39 protein [Bacteroidota bacterium]